MKQLFFSFPNNNAYSNKDFILDSSNDKAYYYINSDSDWGLAPYPNILILCGKSKSGKTHLASIWSKRKKGIFFDVKQDFHLLNNKNVIYDDIHNAEEENFFHFLNERISSDAHTLLTCTKSKLNFSLPDLLSRLNSINKVDLLDPSESHMAKLFNKLFSDLQLNISDNIIKYLVYRTDRTYEAINNIVDIINKESLVYKKEITIPFIKEILEYK